MITPSFTQLSFSGNLTVQHSVVQNGTNWGRAHTLSLPPVRNFWHYGSMGSSKAFVLAGPTAVGKNTVIRDLLDRAPDIWYSISATTRAPRAGEVDGKDYFFVTDAEFDQLVADGNMLEWAIVHGLAKYGTPRKPVDEAIANGRVVLLELDLAGARQVRQSMPEAVHIFLAPPSWEDLEARLRGRGTENSEEQKRRLETARVEMAAEPEFDHVVVNETVADATAEILRIMGLSD